MEDQIKMYKLRLKNAAQLVCISNNNSLFKVKNDLKNLSIIQNGTVIVDQNGKICDLGQQIELENKYKDNQFEQDIDCTGKAILPGFIDAHTHSICPGDRVHEFIMKLEGATYMDIHKAGGGIGFTVNNVKQSSEKDLLSLLLKNLKKMSSLGTTLVEVKSGYGLDIENEIKMLKVIKQAKLLQPLDLVSNFCGGHSIPKGMNESSATEFILNDMIPAIKKSIDQGEIDPEFIDVFCEKGVFERESTKKILLVFNLQKKGLEIGLKPNFHGDEINFIDSGTLGGEVNAQAISHLENLDNNGIITMAKNQVAAVILPTTHYLLKLKDPPVRQLIENGVIFALGSDFNPNAYCMSMPFVMNLACVNLKALPCEALVGATLNAAASLNRSQTHGSIEKGKYGDFVIINHPRWEHIIYQFGHSPIEYVIKKGNIIFKSDN